MDDLERRIDLLEANLRKTQQTVQELMKMNGELITRISELSFKITTLLSATKGVRKSSGAEDYSIEPIERRIERLEKRMNAVVLACSPMMKRKPFMKTSRV